MVRVLPEHDVDDLTVAPPLPPPRRARRRVAVAAALGTARRRLLAAGITAAYLLVYLWAIRHLIVTGRSSAIVDTPSVQVVADWRSRVFDAVAPFSYEPVVAIYPTERVQLFLSPVNVSIGALLGALVAVNTLLAVVAHRAGASCRRNATVGFLGSVPGLLTGFVCCVPTFVLALGAQATALAVGVRTWLFPLAVAILVVTL